MTTVTTKFQRTVVAQKRPTAPPHEEHTYVLTVQDDQSGNIIITGLTAAEAREVAAGLTDAPATNVVTGGQIPLSQLAELRKQIADAKPSDPSACDPNVWHLVTHAGDRIPAKRDTGDERYPWRLSHGHSVSDRIISNPVPLIPADAAFSSIATDAADAVLTTMRHVLGDVDAVRRWEQKIEAAEEEARIYRKRLREAEGRLIAEARAREALSTEAQNAIEDLCEALVQTREDVGPSALWAKKGWAWWDALTEYAPEMAEKILAEEQSDESAARRLAQVGFGHDAWPLLTEDSRDTFRRLHHAGATIPEGSDDE